MALTTALTRRFLQGGSNFGSRSMSSWWGGVEPAPKDPILGVTEAFLSDSSPEKVNVGVGAYRDDNGKPVVLECVREAEKRIAGNLNMEYLPMGGSVNMVDETLKLAYGENSDFIKDKRIAAIQALSGTGACRVFADFQKRFRPESQIYIPIPTWSNHHNIWRDARVPQSTFRYYHPETKGLDFAALIKDVKVLSNGKYKSAEHYVQTTGRETRVSFAVFMHPRPTAKIQPLPLAVERDGGKPRYKEFTFEEHYSNLIQNYSSPSFLSMESLRSF